VSVCSRLTSRGSGCTIVLNDLGVGLSVSDILAAGPPQLKKSRALCWSILLASGVIYSSSFSFMKIAVSGGAKPLGMVFWFAILATCVLGAELAIIGKLGKIDAKLLKFCVPWGILSVIFPNLFFSYAAAAIQASIIAMGIALVPVSR